MVNIKIFATFITPQISPTAYSDEYRMRNVDCRRNFSDSSVDHVYCNECVSTVDALTWRFSSVACAREAIVTARLNGKNLTDGAAPVIPN